MSTQNKIIYLRNYHLLLLIVLSGSIYFLVGHFLPWMSPLIDFLLGPIIYRFAYAVPAKQIIWREFRPVVVIILGSLFGSGLLWIACKFSNASSCENHALQALLFTTLVCPLIIPVILWVFGRLFGLHKRKKGR